jgi:hypothetical protein
MSNENIDPTYANIDPKSGNCIYSNLETISNLTDVYVLYYELSN